MSIISMFGGAEAQVVTEQERRLSELSEKFDELAIKLADLQESLEIAKNRINKNTSDAAFIFANTEGIKSEQTETKYELQGINSRQEELSNAIRGITKAWNGPEGEGMTKRVEELERMQRYFSSSHGKVLNDIHDMKVELHALYKHLKPVSAEEREKSVDPNPKKLNLIEYVQQECPEIENRTRGVMISTMQKNGLIEPESLDRKTFFDFLEMPHVGPWMAGYFCKLRDKFCGPCDHQLKTYFVDNNIWAALDAFDIPMKTKTRAVHVLHSYGINALSDLRKVEFEDLCRIPKAGKTLIQIFNDLYKKYIWA